MDHWQKVVFEIWKLTKSKQPKKSKRPADMRRQKTKNRVAFAMRFPGYGVVLREACLFVWVSLLFLFMLFQLKRDSLATFLWSAYIRVHKNIKHERRKREPGARKKPTNLQSFDFDSRGFESCFTFSSTPLTWFHMFEFLFVFCFCKALHVFEY